MTDLPRDAQEVAEVLKLDEDSAALLWQRWFEAVAPTNGQTETEDVELARAQAQAAEVWDDLKCLKPKEIKMMIAIRTEEERLQAKADAQRAKAGDGWGREGCAALHVGGRGRHPVACQPGRGPLGALEWVRRAVDGNSTVQSLAEAAIIFAAWARLGRPSIGVNGR